MRSGTVTAVLGFRAKSALMQEFGLKNSALIMGPKWVLAGASKLHANPAKYNEIGTVANVGDSVRMPKVGENAMVFLKNNGFSKYDV